MSDTESEQGGSEDVTNEMTFIAEKVHAYPEILEKSQVPAMKNKKTAALTKIVKEYVTMFGKEMENKAFMKKMNNMKTRLKNKTDKNKTGNKRIRLLPWEKVMLEAMNADINPVLSQVPGAVAIGVSTQPSLPTPTDDIMTESDAYQMTASGIAANKKRLSVVQEVLPKKLPPRSALPPKATLVDGKPEETDETRQLTTAQLQRLVLIEQLKVARIQQEYFSTKLQKLAEISNKEPSMVYAVVGDKTYCNL